jgi:signal transduction histidine kinase
MWKRLFQISYTDPDHARRRQLLNLLLACVAGSAIVVLAATAAGLVSNDANDKARIFVALASLSLACLVLYYVGRYWSVRLASAIFLVLIVVAIAFADSPGELVNGRSLFDFVIPIILAGVLLPPSATFVFAGLSDAALLILAWGNGLAPNVPALVGFFIIALVAWLSGRGLENALSELRALNAELETRVQERTRDLREALTRELAEARKNQAILQSIADGVIVFDETGHASVANPAISGLLERPPSRIVGATLDDLLDTAPEADRQRVKDLFQAQSVLPKPEPIVWGDKTLSINVAPLLSAPADPVGFVAVFRDITRETEVSRMKSMIVAMVSHELRTPLNALSGLAEMLAENVYGELNSRQMDVVARILLNAKRLTSLVGDLLDRAQIEAGSLKVEQIAFSPAEVIRPVQEMIGEQARQKRLTFTTSVDPSLPAELIGDPYRLGQIMINLAGNAVKFTENGSVTVRLLAMGPGQWAIEVADTGPGIPISAEAYIFEPFRQVDGSSRRRHGGIGLGLSIVKSLVQVMDGEIRLSSRIGRGTSFTIVLPLRQPERAGAQYRKENAG